MSGSLTGEGEGSERVSHEVNSVPFPEALTHHCGPSDKGSSYTQKCYHGIISRSSSVFKSYILEVLGFFSSSVFKSYILEVLGFFLDFWPIFSSF